MSDFDDDIVSDIDSNCELHDDVCYDNESDPQLVNRINLARVKSFDNRSCVICLIRENEPCNVETISLNQTCKTCKYYVHDSCFSNWYEKYNKCIICRRKIDNFNRNNDRYNYNYDDDSLIVSPRTQAFLFFLENRNIIMPSDNQRNGSIRGGFANYVWCRARTACVNIVYSVMVVGVIVLGMRGCFTIEDEIGNI